ncbi:MAG: formate dehydrogenase accessory protein FdhE [Desulfovibrionaceae bacterium]|nr:formate dehydrogenase accessory protein FdhE [Desulfovibrionaceae bacterium]
MAVETTVKTLAKLRGDKPVLASVLDAFEPLLVARVETAASLQDDVRGLPVPAPDEQRFADGLSLLAEVRLAMFWPLWQKALGGLLPVFEQRPQLVPGLGTVSELLGAGRDETFQEAFLQALLHQDAEACAGLFGTDELSAASLAFVGEFALSAVLRAVATAAAGSAAEGDNPWPLWTQGSCPVCGRLPVMDSLARGLADEKNPYLLSGGGKKHMHCGLCGSDWLFRRAVCPVCGADSKGVMNIIVPTENRSEHIAWCSKCRTYSVGVDERSFSGDLDYDALALGLLPLDMVAAEKELTPMCRTFWNQF